MGSTLILEDGADTDVSEVVLKMFKKLVLSLKYTEVGNGRCDCLGVGSREAVTVANFSLFGAFLTVCPAHRNICHWEIPH